MLLLQQLLLLNFDAAEALVASVGGLVAFIDLDEGSERDLDPLVGAGEVGLGDFATVVV